MTVTRASSRRFRRPETIPGVAATEDDVAILYHVWRHRVLDSKSLYRLFPDRSNQVISRRLRKLWMGGFLDRPLSQNRRNAVTAGSDYLVYAIAREGARLLRDGYNAPIQVERWTQKNAELKPMSIAHHLATARFMVDFSTRAQAVPNAMLRYADEIIAPAPGSKPAGLSYTLRADVPWFIPGKKPGNQAKGQGTAPDQVFALDYNGERQVFFLEIDQGTETIEPGKRRLQTERFWTETSFLRKMLIYGAAFRSGQHTRQFGLPSFRVLTVTTNQRRVAEMQATYDRHLSKGDNKTQAGLFLFTDWETLSQSARPLADLPLVTGTGRTVALI